ncbi:RagB/SusD family nutrient uptake outer membrane protein, partial [uncultured Duncaniella sp.]
MKKIYLAIMAVAALMATSCSDFLDVHPKGEKVEDDLFDSSKGFEDAIYGVYGAMASNSVYGMEMVWGIPELLCQNFECKSTSGKDFSTYDYTTNSTTRDRLKSVWTRAYEAIGYANNVLQNLEKKSPDALPLY